MHLQDLPISRRARGVLRGWVKGESLILELCQAASRNILTAHVSQAAALPHAHPWCHHPMFLDILASLMLGGSESTQRD